MRASQVLVLTVNRVWFGIAPGPSVDRRAFAPAIAVQKSHPCDFCRTPDHSVRRWVV